LPLFTTTYYIGLNDQPFLEGDKLLKFLEFHKVKVPSNYRNDKAVKEAIECISICIRNNIIEEINKCSAINLQIDELTDHSLDKALTMNVRHFSNGRYVSRFLGLIDVPKGDGK